MAVPATPVYLPGGLAMVRDVGGVRSFITDADECCCAGPCAECADQYTVTPTSAACNFDFVFILPNVGDPLTPCWWHQTTLAGSGCGSGGFFPVCQATIVGAPGGTWTLTITTGDGSCAWEKIGGDCPDGTYALTVTLGCGVTCDANVTVFSV